MTSDTAFCFHLCFDDLPGKKCAHFLYVFPHLDHSVIDEYSKINVTNVDGNLDQLQKCICWFSVIARKSVQLSSRKGPRLKERKSC